MMPKEFIERLKRDLIDKDDDFYKSLTIPKEKIDSVLSGTTLLLRVKVIGLARRLNQPIKDYIWLAGLQPKMFDELLAEESIKSSIAGLDRLSDEDLDKQLDSMNSILEDFLAKKLKEREKKE